MRPLRAFLLISIFVFAAPRASAVTLESLTPANPTAGDLMTALVLVPGLCENDLTTTFEPGNVIHTSVDSYACFGGPPPFPLDREIHIGPLPVGTYTYRLTSRSRDDELPPELVEERTFEVTPSSNSAQASSPASPRSTC